VAEMKKPCKGFIPLFFHILSWVTPFITFIRIVREHFQIDFGMLNVIVILSSDLPFAPSLASHYKSNLLTTEAYNMLLENIVYCLTSFYPFLHWTIASCYNKNFIMSWAEPPPLIDYNVIIIENYTKVQGSRSLDSGLPSY